MQILGGLAALCFAGAMIAFPFIADNHRQTVLYVGLCALGVTVAVVCWMGANLFDMLLKHARQVEGTLSSNENRQN
jgi:hypothetical protein